MKSILTSLLCLSLSLAQAQFSGFYDPSNWSLTHSDGNDNGYVNTGGAPASIQIVGSESNCGCGTVVTYSITAEACGTISFDWTYTTDDRDGSSFDPFGYFLNGNPVQLSINGYPDGSTHSGSASVSVNEGDSFAFYIFSTDNILGRAWSTITNFSGPGACDLTVSIDDPGTLYYGYGPASCAQLTATASSSNGPVTLVWSDNGGYVCADSPDCITMTVTATDAACCVATATIVVNVVDASCHTSNGNPKVELCHNGNTICVAPSAVAAHLAHGDVLGACDDESACEGVGLVAVENHDQPSTSTHDQSLQVRSSSLASSLSKLEALSGDRGQASNLVLNPNPASDIVSLTIHRGIEGPAKITIFNAAGQLMSFAEVDIVSTVPVQLNVADLPVGQYALYVEGQNGLTQTEKLTIGRK